MVTLSIPKSVSLNKEVNSSYNNENKSLKT